MLFFPRTLKSKLFFPDALERCTTSQIFTSLMVYVRNINRKLKIMIIEFDFYITIASTTKAKPEIL